MVLDGYKSVTSIHGYIWDKIKNYRKYEKKYTKTIYGLFWLLP